MDIVQQHNENFIAQLFGVKFIHDVTPLKSMSYTRDTFLLFV